MGKIMLPCSSFSLTVTAGYGSLINAISLPSVVTFLRFHLSCTIAFLEDISNLSSRNDLLEFFVLSCYCLLKNNCLTLTKDHLLLFQKKCILTFELLRIGHHHNLDQCQFSNRLKQPEPAHR